MHPAWKTQIVLLLAEKVIIPNKYSNFADVFLKEFAVKLPKCSNINKYAIELERGK